MRLLLIILIGVALVVGVLVATWIGPSYLDASAAIQRSKGVRHPELIRNAVLAAETAHRKPANTFAVQLAKLYAARNFAPSRQLSRHLREFLLLQAISLRYSDEDILAAYLDNVYLGRNIAGVEAAARIYFGKSMEELDAAESALLAALIRSPASYSPSTHPDRALERRNMVLRRMLENGAIDHVTYSSAVMQPVRPAA